MYSYSLIAPVKCKSSINQFGVESEGNLIVLSVVHLIVPWVKAR